MAMRDDDSAIVPYTESWAAIFAHLADEAPDLQFHLAPDDISAASGGAPKLELTRSETSRSLVLGGLFGAFPSLETLEPEPPSPVSELLFPAALASCPEIMELGSPPTKTEDSHLVERIHDVDVGRKARIVNAMPGAGRISRVPNVESLARLPLPRFDIDTPPTFGANSQNTGSQNWLPRAGRTPELVSSLKWQIQPTYSREERITSVPAETTRAFSTVSAIHGGTLRDVTNGRENSQTPLSNSLLDYGARNETQRSFSCVSGYRAGAEVAQERPVKSQKLASRAKGFIRRVVSGKGASSSA